MPDRDMSNWKAFPDSDRELDLLIRNAAATYGEPASNSDLVERILSRVRTENAQTPARRWWPWAAALPIAACLVILVMLVAPKAKHVPLTPSNQAHISAQSPDSAGSTTPAKSIETAQTSRARSSRPRENMRHSGVAANTRSLPKLDTFPAPQVLTPEEQALATYAAHAPEEQQRALIEAHDKLEAPLTIAAISIQPLEPPAPGGN